MTYFFQTRPDIPSEMMGRLTGMADTLFLTGQWDRDAECKALWGALRKQQIEAGCGVIASECWANCALEIMGERVDQLRAAGAYQKPASPEARQ